MGVVWSSYTVNSIPWDPYKYTNMDVPLKMPFLSMKVTAFFVLLLASNHRQRKNQHNSYISTVISWLLPHLSTVA